MVSGRRLDYLVHVADFMIGLGHIGAEFQNK